MSLRLDHSDFDTAVKLRRFVQKYVKVLQSQKKRPMAMHLLERELASEAPSGEVQSVSDSELAAWELDNALGEVMDLQSFDSGDRAEILAFVRKRFQQGKRDEPNRGQAGRFTGQAQGGGGFRAAGVAPRLPPRSKADMSCVNCGQKGNMASECSQPKADMGKRPCFTCGGTGHLARNCPNPKKQSLKLFDAQATPVKTAFLGCVTVANDLDAEGFTRVGRPRAQGARVLDFVSRESAQNASKNRCRASTTGDFEEYAIPKVEQGEEWSRPRVSAPLKSSTCPSLSAAYGSGKRTRAEDCSCEHTDETVDGGFDQMVASQWRDHMSILSVKNRKGKAWGSEYWKSWYNDMVLDVDEDKPQHISTPPPSGVPEIAITHTASAETSTLSPSGVSQMSRGPDEREVPQSRMSTCWSFSDPVEDEGVRAHNSQVARLIVALGEKSSGRRAIIQAVAAEVGITDKKSIDRFANGTAHLEERIAVPTHLRQAMCDAGLHGALAPISLITAIEKNPVFLADGATWEDLDLKSHSTQELLSMCVGRATVQDMHWRSTQGAKEARHFLWVMGAPYPTWGIIN